jgi:PAS domain S-box-containing protein
MSRDNAERPAPQPQQQREGIASLSLSRGRTPSERLLVAAAAVPLFAAVFALGLAVDEPGEAVSVLYTIPIALIAIEFGALAGLAAGAVALGLFGIVVAANGMDVGPLGFATRAVCFGILGGLLGRYSSRLRVTHEAVEDRERQLQAIIDNTTAVIYVKDPAGRYVLINRQFEELFHIRRQDAVGKTDLDLFPQYMADAFRANDRRVLREREVLEFEEVAPHDDGPHTYISIKFPLYDQGESPYAICGISTDISRRKRAEQELKEGKDRIRDILDTAKEAFIAMDESGTITAWNRAAEATFGWPASKAIGRTAADVVIPERYREAHERGLRTFLEKGHGPMLNRRVELTALHRDGHEFPIEMTIAPVRVRGGFSFNAFLHDISDRKRADGRQVEV